MRKKRFHVSVRGKIGIFLLALSILSPIAALFFTEGYQKEIPLSGNLQNLQLVVKKGVEVEEVKKKGMAKAVTLGIPEVRKNVGTLVAPQTANKEKFKLLSALDGEFKSLPDGEKEKVLRVLTPRELAGVYICASGYSLDTILGPEHAVDRLAILYIYIIIGSLIVLLGGILLLLL